MESEEKRFSRKGKGRRPLFLSPSNSSSREKFFLKISHDYCLLFM
jgi:hypothetical protein